ncbi:MAG: hypothetical protein ACT6TH_13960 [Brevundimonas sp.]|jgi:TolA-binding protein|uniref:hypothetical protein n=1 Tax=Brevundimonas sp. TaxID=1871086 RepID=UPI004034BE33
MRTLVAVLALAVSMPVIAAPVTADAQIQAGGRAAARTPRVSREERLTNLRNEAEDRLLAIEEQIASIRQTGETAGGLTDGQQRQLAQLNQRKEREQREIARFEEALGGS